MVQSIFTRDSSKGEALNQNPRRFKSKYLRNFVNNLALLDLLNIKQKMNLKTL